MASSTIRKVFEQGTAAFNGHDIDAFGETMADDVSTRAPGVGVLRGKQAVKAFYGSWLEAFPDGRVEIQATHVLDDVVVEEGVFSGTHRATLRSPGGDLPATNREVHVPYLQVLRFRGERIASLHLEFDRAELLDQLGLTTPVAHEATAAAASPSELSAYPH